MIGNSHPNALFADQLNVLEPAFLVAQPEDAEVRKNSRATFSCAAFGSPTPVIVWNSSSLVVADFSNHNDQGVSVYNQEVNTSENLTLVVSLLELCEVDEGDAGVYMCTAYNGEQGESLGIQSQSFELKVLSKLSSISDHVTRHRGS